MQREMNSGDNTTNNQSGIGGKLPSLARNSGELRSNEPNMEQLKSKI